MTACIIYKPITTLQDAKQLQEDLCKICEWTNKWQMKLNVDKCAVLHCTCSLTPIQHTYTLMDHNLEVKKLHTYLDLGIDNTISWSLHIQMICNRSTKVLNFTNRTYITVHLTLKTVYLTLVRPIMEYAAPVRDLYYNTDIYKLEKV